jgi:DNA-binding transcriptional MerR regulator
MENQWIIPGTVLKIRRADADRVDGLFQSMFLTGGMVLSQVSNISGLESYAVQNWVKRGFLSPPKQKRYDMDQVCRILTINAFKSVLPMERICSLLEYVNGNLGSSTDDIIRDSDLYFLFVKLAGRVKTFESTEEATLFIEDSLADYAEPIPGARQRVAKALRIMVIAWLAARIRQASEELLDELETEKEELTYGAADV